MTDPLSLARQMIAFDTQSASSNRALADFLEDRLKGFDIERLDFEDSAGVAKSALVARRGARRGRHCLFRPYGHGSTGGLAPRSIYAAD